MASMGSPVMSMPANFSVTGSAAASAVSASAAVSAAETGPAASFGASATAEWAVHPVKSKSAKVHAKIRFMFFSSLSG